MRIPISPIYQMGQGEQGHIPKKRARRLRRRKERKKIEAYISAKIEELTGKKKKRKLVSEVQDSD